MNEVTEQRPRSGGQIQNLWRTDTLTLFAEFEECGEWGGHTEIFKIYSKSDKPMTSGVDLWFEYKRDSVNCSGDPNENRKWIQRLMGKLTTDNERQVIEYVHDLLDQTFNEKHFGHSGQYYSIFNNDSSVFISNYEPPVEGFIKLKAELVR